VDYCKTRNQQKRVKTAAITMHSYNQTENAATAQKNTELKSIFILPTVPKYEGTQDWTASTAMRVSVQMNWVLFVT